MKTAMFVLSWFIASVALLCVLGHCWTTRERKQPYLLASNLAMTLSLALSIPYAWNLVLQRYRLMSNMLITLVCSLILASAYLHE